MSVQINVYTARKDPLLIEDLLAGLHKRGVEATWAVDEVLAEEGAPWSPGVLSTPEGGSVEVGWQQIFPGEQSDLVRRAASVSADASTLAPEFKNSYRLIARAADMLLWATADTIAELTPSLILDTDSGALYDRDAFSLRSPGVLED